MKQEADVLVVGLLHKVRCDFAKVGRLVTSLPARVVALERLDQSLDVSSRRTN